jgi:hypothetical protein
MDKARKGFLARSSDWIQKAIIEAIFWSIATRISSELVIISVLRIVSKRKLIQIITFEE